MTYGTAIDKNRVATYIRWSTDEQTEGTTLEVQREACRLFVESQGWNFRENLVFVDDGYSGGCLDRPGLTRLRRAVTEGEVTCVVVYKLDRLSRSVLDTVKLALEEWDGVCYIRSAREPIDTSSPTGAIFFYMLASYAEWERSIIRERTMSGKIKRAQQGKNPGFTAPYGYKSGEEPGQFDICEHEAAIVRRIFRDYISGLGINSIAGKLNTDGIRNRKGTYWRGAAIADIVQNPFYKGLLRYGLTAVTSKAQRRQVGKVRVSFEEPRYAHVDGAVPAIIAAEEFERAQRVKAGRTAVLGFRSRGAEYLLTGIARCRCGAAIRGDGRGKLSAGYRYYRCAGDTAANPQPCGCGVIPADRLEQAVLAKVREATAPGTRELLLASWQADTDQEIEALLAQVQQVQAALHQVEKTKARMVADYRAGDLSARLFSAEMEHHERESEDLQRSLDAMAAAKKRLETAQVDLAEFEEVLQKVDSWEALQPEEQKQLLRHLIGRCEVYRKRNGSSKVNPFPVEVDLDIRRAGT